LETCRINENDRQLVNHTMEKKKDYLHLFFSAIEYADFVLTIKRKSLKRIKFNSSVFVAFTGYENPVDNIR
jgi:hypothetical protein